MGKDLKGKELGRGISQRKDKYYVGRYTATPTFRLTCWLTHGLTTG